MSDYTIGIKLGDGSFYPILEEGFTGKKRIVLSTVRDNQESVQIDFYRNQDSDIKAAEYIGSLMIEDIRPSPKGEPEIEVILGLDKENKLNAVAKNLASEDKQTLSVVLESLEGEGMYDMPEFELGEDIETTKVLDEEGSEEESITGDTYPFEEEDRRKKHLKKKRNPLFIILFVLVGLIGVAGLLILVYWIWTNFGPVKEPLTTERTEQTTETTGQEDKDTTENSNNADSQETGESGEKEGEGALGENNQGEKRDQADNKDSSDQGASEKKTEPVKTGFYYVIKRGDTLWDISANFYRDPFQWYKIYREPKNNIKNPDLIFAGRKLYIPEK